MENAKIDILGDFQTMWTICSYKDQNLMYFIVGFLVLRILGM